MVRYSNHSWNNKGYALYDLGRDDKPLSGFRIYISTIIFIIRLLLCGKLCFIVIFGALDSQTLADLLNFGNRNEFTSRTFD